MVAYGSEKENLILTVSLGVLCMSNLDTVVCLNAHHYYCYRLYSTYLYLTVLVITLNIYHFHCLQYYYFLARI